MTESGRGRRANTMIGDPPSMTDLAADALRRMILDGDLAQGERVIENQLTTRLGISRPPLREALRILQQEGLIEQLPRRGAVVRVLTLPDVYEIVTLRMTLETMAVRLGVPRPDPARLAGLRAALETWERNAADGREDLATEDSSRFHLALVGLAGHSRLDDAYRAIALQLRMCMQLNRRARADSESLTDRAARHRRLFEFVESGDVEAVLTEITDPASVSFVLTYALDHPPTTPESRAWLESLTPHSDSRSETWGE